MMLSVMVEPFIIADELITLDVMLDVRISLATARLSVIVDRFDEVLIRTESCIVEDIADELINVLFIMTLSLTVELMMTDPFTVAFSILDPVTTL